jgi:hypothetical protein
MTTNASVLNPDLFPERPDKSYQSELHSLP